MICGLAEGYINHSANESDLIEAGKSVYWSFNAKNSDMKKRLALILPFFFACTALLFSQNTFTKTYGLPPSYEGLEDIVEAEGRYYALGSKYSSSTQTLDMYLVVLSLQGELIDEFTFNAEGTRAETGKKIVRVSDGLLLLGQVTDHASFQAGFLAVKVSFEGQMQWTIEYGNPGLVETFGDAAAMGEEESVLLIGARERGSRFLYLIEINPSGEILKEVETTFTVTGDNQLAIASRQGGWYIGYSGIGGRQYIARLNENLEPEWQINNTEIGINSIWNIHLLFELDNGNLLTGYEIRGYTAVVVLTPDGSLVADAPLETDGSGAVYPVGAIQLANGNVLLAVRSSLEYIPQSELREINIYGEELTRTEVTNECHQPNTILLAASGILLAGTTFENQGGADAKVVALSGAQEIQWASTAGSPGRYGEEFGYGIIEGQNHSFYIIGTETLRPGNQNILLTKIDSSGEVLWQSSFGQEGIDIAFSLTLATDGHVGILAYSFTEIVSQVVIYKVSPDGQLIWETGYDPAEYLQGFKGGIAPLPDGGLVAGCHTYSQQALLIRVSSEGDIEWVHKEKPSLGGEVVDLDCHEVALSDDGNILLAGNATLAGGTTGALILKYKTENGIPLWSTFLERETAARIYSLATGEDGSIYGLGRQQESNRYSRILFKLSSEGDSLWLKTSPADTANYLANNSIACAPGRQFLLVGAMKKTTAENSIENGILTGYATLVNEDGEEIWSNEFSPGFFTMLYDGVSVTDGGFALAGFMHDNQTPDICLIKTTNDGALLTLKPLFPDIQLRLFPIPASEKLQFEIDGPARGGIQVILWDIKGKQLWRQHYDKLSETLTDALDIAFLPSGSYVLSALVNGARYSQQWVKL